MNDNEDMNGAIPILGKRPEEPPSPKTSTAASPVRAALDAIQKGEIPAGAQVYVAIGWEAIDPNTGKKAKRLWRGSHGLDRMDVLGFLDIHHYAILTGQI